MSDASVGIYDIPHPCLLPLLNLINQGIGDLKFINQIPRPSIAPLCFVMKQRRQIAMDWCSLLFCVEHAVISPPPKKYSTSINPSRLACKTRSNYNRMEIIFILVYNYVHYPSILRPYLFLVSWLIYQLLPWKWCYTFINLKNKLTWMFIRISPDFWDYSVQLM